MKTLIAIITSQSKVLRYAVFAVLCSPSLVWPQSPLAGSHATREIIFAAQADFKSKFYKSCNRIQILEALDLRPVGMREKKTFNAGDKWEEKWRINACGEIAVHWLAFEMIAIKGQTALSMRIGPAENAKDNTKQLSFDGLNWEVGSSDYGPNHAFVEYVIKGESIEAWTRLFTLAEGKSTLSAAELIASHKKKFAAEGCPASDFRIIHDGEGDVIYFWGYSQCTVPKEEFNIGRVVSKDSKIYFLTHAARKQPAASELKRISTALKNFKIR
ncbi:MAG: hypothetical protein JNJ69_05075 [Leptospiraceae bacterium]|nr:hypothetical protein [Leptospiraceae bacterium]